MSDARRGRPDAQPGDRGAAGPSGPALRGGARWLQQPERAKNTRATMGRLWQVVRGERRALLLLLALVLVTSSVALLVPFMIGRAIDALAAGASLVSFDSLFAVLFALGVSYAVDTAVGFGQGWMMSGMSQRVVAAIRGQLFAKLQRLPIGFFDTHEHGDLMSRVANDVDSISMALAQMTGQLMGNVLAIAGSLVMMLVLSPVMTAAALITVPLVFLLSRTIARRTRILFRMQQAALGGLNGHVEETVSGVAVVKAFEQEQQVIDHFGELNGTLRRASTSALIWSGFLMPLMNVIGNLGFVAVAAVGGIAAVRGDVTIGIMASFLSYSRQFARPLNEIANVYNSLQSAVAGAERVFEVIDETEELPDGPHAVAVGRPAGHVVFDRVSFEYVPGVTVLHGISFAAPPGSATALVGPTGAGKTTIVNLLARFYEISDGRILIDGRDLRDYTRDSLRRCFGIVLQDTYLFGATIRDNIAYGNPAASEAQVVVAAVAANADHFIRRFHNGYDTMLTESGANLSQGQRQLLAIARAVLADPAILILDEATSNVDTRTELHIQEAMLALMRGRTSFIIAHRLSTIRDADRILVIDAGRMAMEGTHADLLTRPGVYREMYESQQRGVQV
jgi:ATP-binding cassette subfamily B multidrug efflux pump